MSARPLWIALFAMLTASPAPALAQDLMSLYRVARERDPIFEAARRQFDATAQKLVQAGAALFPSVGLNANASRQQGEASFNGADYADRTVRNSGWTLQVSQPLWRPALKDAYSQAGLQVRQAQELFTQAETELMLRVSQAYFDALVAREGARVADSQIRAVEQQLALARRNFEVGLTTVTDVHEALARLELARAQGVVALTEIETRNAELEKLLGHVPDRLARLKPDALPPALAPTHAKDWVDGALAENALVRAQQFAVEIADEEIAKLDRGHGPTLDATAGLVRNASTGSFTSPAELASRSRSVQVGLQFSLPLYAGGAVRSRVQEAIALRAKAAAELEATRRLVTAQVRQAFAGSVKGLAQIQALAAAASASKAAVASNKVGYRIGTRLNIDVLNAEQQQFLVERDLHKARAETILQTLRLKAAHARLQEADLQSISELLKEEE